ncbi:MAG: hypothetical protein NXH85_14600 [Pseudomonadaceae bacterium]|nr:hypothetical protein [Pseudomonadaceae bacterium]
MANGSKKRASMRSSKLTNQSGHGNAKDGDTTMLDARTSNPSQQQKAPPGEIPDELIDDAEASDLDEFDTPVDAANEDTAYAEADNDDVFDVVDDFDGDADDDPDVIEASLKAAPGEEICSNEIRRRLEERMELRRLSEDLDYLDIDI